MDSMDALIAARAALRDVTPLDADCGALCEARCCKSNNVGEGMCLFPGEEALYAGADWAKVYGTGDPHVKILVCGDTCPREERPLACRIFPLTPVMRGNTLKLRMDERAKGLCPLYDSGKRGLSAAFIKAVKGAMERLAEDDEQRAFLQLWGDMHDEFARMERLAGR